MEEQNERAAIHVFVDPYCVVNFPFDCPFFLSLHVFTFSSCFLDSSHVMLNDERTFILTTHGLSLIL